MGLKMSQRRRCLWVWRGFGTDWSGVRARTRRGKNLCKGKCPPTPHTSALCGSPMNSEDLWKMSVGLGGGRTGSGATRQ
jgi:hypothetical protein